MEDAGAAGPGSGVCLAIAGGLYPPDVLVDWVASLGVFHRPIIQGDVFVHPVAPAVIKWLARVRMGCLTTRMRLVGHGLATGPVICLCCGASNKDNEHLFTGSVATGAADWLASLLEVWRATPGWRTMASC